MVTRHLLYRFLSGVFWLYYKIELVLSQLGIIFVNLLWEFRFYFLKIFCIFLSVAAAESAVIFLKCFVFNNSILSVYLVLSNIATALALSCFKIRMFLLSDRLSIIFLNLYRTSISLYFPQVLLSVAFNDVKSLSGISF